MRIALYISDFTIDLLPTITLCKVGNNSSITLGWLSFCFEIEWDS